ncbi:MAG: hypothetical protein MI922_28000, partial [Bacteroidales bacterium]|nr:hypothetical protein [Bacteroidales bacterium]
MNKLTIIITFLTLTVMVNAQKIVDNYMILTYDQVIKLSQEQSPAALSRKTEKKNSYWEYKSFKSNYLPQLVLNTDVPGFLKQYTPYIDKEGNVEYTLVHRSISGAALKAEQLIGLTGGNIYVNTDLDPIYDFKNDSLSYRYSPIAIGLVQPLMKFNPHRWDKKIEELRFRESEKKYCI